ncbi:MAG TPA: cytochrome C oxidase subunit IV family protein [Methylomirabilota bacterium]|jgi:hypothetical protein|nr:cytochrome C oxidase subunit IV family protein [Methylomirabilota bacterium]
MRERSGHQGVGGGVAMDDARPTDGRNHDLEDRVIAAAKALLIILYFMHVRFASGVTRLVVVAGILWLST